MVETKLTWYKFGELELEEDKNYLLIKKDTETGKLFVPFSITQQDSRLFDANDEPITNHMPNAYIAKIDKSFYPEPNNVLYE